MFLSESGHGCFHTSLPCSQPIWQPPWVLPTIGTWIVGQGAIDGMDALQQTFFMVLCLTPVAFFHNFHLYSYHLIYFPRRHLMQLARACGLGLFSIVIMTLTYKWPEFMSPDLFIPCVVAFSVTVLLINRFLINRFIAG